MKKRFLSMILAGPALVCAVSCAEKESLEPVPSDARVPMTFTAEAPATKTALQNDGKVFWTEGDAIGIFDGNAEISKFTATNADGASSTAEFSGSAVPGADYYAIYPYSEDASFSGNTLSSILPAEQHYVEGTFETMLNPSAAKASGGSASLFFSNVASILQVNLSAIPDGKTVREIKVTANESVAGAYTVDMSKDEYAASASGETVSSITYKAETGSLPAGVYNIVLLPGTYSEMKLFIVFDDCSYVKIALKDDNAETMTLSASKIAKVDISSIPESAIHTDLYGLYSAGADIEIGGRVYNKKDYGEAMLIEADHELTTLISNNCGVYFVDSEATLTFNYTGAVYKLLIIGNSPDRKSKLVSSTFIRSNPLGNEDGEFLAYNVDWDCTNIGNYVAVGYYGKEALNDQGAFNIVDSKVKMSHYPLLSLTNAGRYYRSIVLKGVDFDMSNFVQYLNNSGKTATPVFINMSSNTVTMPEITLENNVFYAASDKIVDFLMYTGYSSTIGKVSMLNNTFVNTHSKNGYFRYKTLNQVVLKNNLFYMENQTSNIYIFRPYSSSLNDATKPYEGNPSAAEIENNRFYSEATNGKQWFFGGVDAVTFTFDDFERLSGTPFINLNIQTEDFRVNAENSTYGAQRSLPEEGAVAEAFDDLSNVDGSFDYKTN